MTDSFEVCGKTAHRIPYEAPRGSEWGVFFHQRLGTGNPWWSIPFRTFSEAEAFWAELVESSKSDGSGRTHIIVNEYSKDGPDWLFENKQERDDEQTHRYVEGTWR